MGMLKSLIGMVSGPSGASGRVVIDRQALVARHAIAWDALTGQVPLGNGEFCFNADGSGLQTFGGNTMAHWGWHSAPLPEGASPADVPATGTVETGRILAGMRVASARPDVSPWMFRNPHRLNLARLRLCRGDGRPLTADEITGASRRLDLWSGLHTARFQLAGVPVSVATCVHPTLDLVAVRVESARLARADLQVVVDFPYPTLQTEGCVGDFTRPGDHRTALTPRGSHRVDLRRSADTTIYHVALTWAPGCELRTPAPHAVAVAGSGAGALELVCAFAAGALPAELPGFAETRAASAAAWERFWSTGGAIDLSESRDPRWRELERRIVLSQYLLAVQSAGSWPPAEIGLMGVDGWSGQFHMEMVWWHLAHYALWGRWALARPALTCYPRFLARARQLAQQFGYRGAKWGKQVGPEGRTAPWVGSFVLHWQQPHPLFFAELEYRLQPDHDTLERWREVVFATADYLADFPTRDVADGRYHLQPIMPPSEQGITRDTVFDLAYFRFGLDVAQAWRRRLGLSPDPHWAEVRDGLAPLPVQDGLYVHSPEWAADTYGRRAYEHPDMLGVCGMLPPMAGVDPDTARRTLRRVIETWSWDRGWGWDFPWTAMAAARLGEPRAAVDSLLHPSRKNHYDERGVCTGGPCPYLPGNGGLLYAVAMMAAGWDGAPDRPAPGFPDDGSWTVRSEGLSRAP